MRIAAIVTALATSILSAQEAAPQQGAKALFLDPTSGAALASTKNATSGQQKGAVPKKPTDARPMVNAGMMYYIERQGPDGQFERVNPTVTFHSGDKIRIQLKSNVEGRLVIAQRDSEGGSGVLFPDPRVERGDNRIHAGQMTVLPSASTWFKFDEHPGEERLLVLLTPEGNQVTPGAFPEVPPKQWDTRRTEQAVQLAQVQKGSKALVIEVDDTKAAPATYVVQPAGQMVAQGVITTEIVLQHK